jgi:hypothetical protein
LYVTGNPFTSQYWFQFRAPFTALRSVCITNPFTQGDKMKFEMKPTTTRAGIIGGVVAAVVHLFALIPFLGCVIGPLGLLIPLGAGAYSVMLGRQAGGASGEVGQDGVDGGIGGAIAGVIGGVVGVLVSILSAALNIGTSSASPTDAAGGVAVLGVALIVGLCIGVVVSVIFGGVLGAVGGVVYGMIAKNQGGATTGGASTGAPKM